MIKRYSISTIGIFLIALGAALSIKACAGINGLNAPAYALNTEFPAVSVGTFNFIIHSMLLLIQLAVLGKRFKWEDLLQVPANLLLGVFIDISVRICDALLSSPATLFAQILLIAASCLFTAAGVSIGIRCKAWMLPTEMTARALTTATGKDFSIWKITVDCTFLIGSVILCLAFFGQPLGTESTNVLGWGTIVLALCVGLCIKLTQPLVDRILAKL